MRTFFIVFVILFWFSLTSFAACKCKCTFVQEFVIPISTDGVCGARYILRKGAVYKCTCHEVQKSKRV